jgi:hypothetical protein
MDLDGGVSIKLHQTLEDELCTHFSFPAQITAWPLPAGHKTKYHLASAFYTMGSRMIEIVPTS